MKLLLHKDKAIKIIEDRIAGIHEYNFNAEAWKERTVLDLKEIFPPGSMQFLKIEFLRFDTFIEANKAKVMAETKLTAEEILKSYIEYIKEHSKVAEEKKIVTEKDYEVKYFEILKDWNELVTEFNKMIKDYGEQLDKSEDLLSSTENLTNQIETLKKETIQIDNITFSQLSKAFYNLPIWQIITIFSIFIAIIVGVFGLGSLYKEIADNNLIYDYRIENTELKRQKEVNHKEVSTLKHENEILIKKIKNIETKKE